MKRKIIYALLSVVIAFGLWIYVVTTVSPEWEETYYDIPVKLNNMSVLHENGLMIMEEEMPTVTLKLLGNRRDLVTLNRDNIVLTVNLATVYEKGEQQLSYAISYPPNIPSNSIEVVNKIPQVLTLTVIERKTVQVPVELDYGGTSEPEGYRKDTENMILDHSFISVSGPVDVVDRLATAKVFVDLTDQTKTISKSFPYTLHDENGAVVESEWLDANVSEVNLTLKIQPYKMVDVGLNIIAGGGVTENRIFPEWDVKQILISGPQQALDAIGDKVLVDVDLAKISATNLAAQVQYEITLPEGVEIISGNDIVNVTVNFPSNLDAKIFWVRVELIGDLPEGLTANPVAPGMRVYIRGVKEELDNLKAEDLKLQVDITGAKVGTDTYEVKLSPESEQYGLLDEGGKPYTVTVEVKAATA